VNSTAKPSLVPATNQLISNVQGRIVCAQGAENEMLVCRLFGLSVAVPAMLVVAGCAAPGVQAPPPSWVASVPADAPPRPAVLPPFPDLYEQPPSRATRLMSEQEQAEVEAQLNAARTKVDAQADALQKERAGGSRR
jgi:hypothetical protein